MSQATYVTQLIQLLSGIRQHAQISEKAMRLSEAMLQDDTLSEDWRRLYLTMVGEIELLSEEYQRLATYREQSQAIFRFTQTLFGLFNVEETYRLAHELIRVWLRPDVFFIALIDDTLQRMYVPYYDEQGVRYDPVTLRMSQGIVGHVVRTKKPLLLHTEEDFRDLPRLKWGQMGRSVASAIFVPLFIRDTLRGVMAVESYLPHAFSPEDMHFLQMVGSQVIVAIEAAKLHQEVERLSFYDALTELRNRRSFERDLYIFAESADNTRPLALMMIDADDLKRFNDTYGHEAGDLLLKSIAGVLRASETESIRPYRFAGDEFVVLIKEHELPAIHQYVEHLVQHFQESELYIDAIMERVHVSIGIALYPNHVIHINDLLKAADKALYLSKSQGKIIAVPSSAVRRSCRLVFIS
ncbi:MAG: GGDEF domain-containing protein [Candidatus Carbobacillus altaicus]|nr:GGDEF domain-containing protein [Candidatus Carbobacillus altaicus]